MFLLISEIFYSFNLIAYYRVQEYRVYILDKPFLCDLESNFSVCNHDLITGDEEEEVGGGGVKLLSKSPLVRFGKALWN